MNIPKKPVRPDHPDLEKPHFIITLRQPVSVFLSTIEKSDTLLCSSATVDDRWVSFVIIGYPGLVSRVPIHNIAGIINKNGKI